MRQYGFEDFARCRDLVKRVKKALSLPPEVLCRYRGELGRIEKDIRKQFAPYALYFITCGQRERDREALLAALDRKGLLRARRMMLEGRLAQADRILRILRRRYFFYREDNP